MISIKKAGIGDIEIIRALALQTWPEAYGNILGKQQLDYMLELFYHAAALQKQMEEMNHQFILIYASGKPAGFASYSHQSNNTAVFRLHKLYVLPDMQVKGLGKFMLDHIISDISSKQAKWLELNVNRENKAILFYTKNGFTITREEDIDIGEGFFMNDFVMTKQL